MKCDELTPIDLECNMGKDSVTGLVNREPWKAYDIDEVDAAIAELKSENKMLKEHIANGDVSRITWIDEATELKAENEQLKAKLETVNELVKTSRKFLDDAMEAPTFEKDKEIARLKESVKFFSDTLHRESDSAKECFRFLMEVGLISSWGLTDKFFVTAKYSKEHLKKFESQEAENEKLKAKLESVQATAYADSVDAGIRERRLKRALWLTRARTAYLEFQLFVKDSVHTKTQVPSQRGRV